MYVSYVGAGERLEADEFLQPDPGWAGKRDRGEGSFWRKADVQPDQEFLSTHPVMALVRSS